MESTTKDRIKELATQIGMTSTEVARTAGLTYKMLWKSLNNERVFKPNELVAIAKTLNTTIDYLLGETDDPRASQDKEFTETIGTRIRDMRVKNQLHYTELAKLLHISPGIITRWEKGEDIPSANNLILLAIALNTSTSYLLGEIDDSSPFVQPLLMNYLKSPEAGVAPALAPPDVIAITVGDVRMEFPKETPGEVIAMAIESARKGVRADEKNEAHGQ